MDPERLALARKRCQQLFFLRFNWFLDPFRSVGQLSTCVCSEASEAAKQHVNSITTCVLYPTSWFKEDQEGAAFSFAPSTSFGEQYAFHYK